MTVFIITLAVFYCLLVGLLCVFQRRVMYLPDKNIGQPAQYGLEGFTEYTAPSSGNVSVQLWHRPAREGFPTVVYYHGNAYHMGARAKIYGALAEKGFGVLGVSYRGYGKSTGSPTEQGLYDDARTALRFLTDTQHIPLSRIILFGESLGTGVAIHMAKESEVAGLVLQAAYKSVVGRAAEIYRFAPVNLLIRDRYESLAKIPHVKAPLLLFHGERDDTIPIVHGKTVFEAATSPKRAFFFPEKSHNDFDSTVISAHVLDFAREHKLIG